MSVLIQWREVRRGGNAQAMHATGFLVNNLAGIVWVFSLKHANGVFLVLTQLAI